MTAERTAWSAVVLTLVRGAYCALIAGATVIALCALGGTLDRDVLTGALGVAAIAFTISLGAALELAAERYAPDFTGALLAGFLAWFAGAIGALAGYVELGYLWGIVDEGTLTHALWQIQTSLNEIWAAPGKFLTLALALAMPLAPLTVARLSRWPLLRQEWLVLGWCAVGGVVLAGVYRHTFAPNSGPTGLPGAVGTVGAIAILLPPVFALADRLVERLERARDGGA
jgi:hypothetical protein